MKTHFTRTMLSFLTVLCLLTGSFSFALAEPTVAASDFGALLPFMDLVASAAMTAADEPEVIGNEETTLSPAFVSAFFNNGLTSDASLGITEDVLADTAKQQAFLSKGFAAQLPTLEVIAKTNPISGYIGFQPVTVSTLESGEVQIIGELYWGNVAMRSMTDTDYHDIQWLDRAVYTLREDATGMNGYRLTGFAVGSELNMEAAIQTYAESILVEYINTQLGFSILYPSIFTDEMLVENEEGVSAALPDGNVAFFVRRIANTDSANLADYIGVIANGIPGAKATIHEELSAATVTYTTEDGMTVFDDYIVTDKYIYQAELSYRTNMTSTYSMYTSYLENSFSVDEVSMG